MTPFISLVCYWCSVVQSTEVAAIQRLEMYYLKVTIINTDYF